METIVRQYTENIGKVKRGFGGASPPEANGMLKKSNKMEASPFQRRGGGAVAWWLTPRTPDPGLLCCVLEQDIFTPPPKVLVIPRKRWLRPIMTEKLFTRTLSIKPNQNQILFDESDFFFF